MALTGAIPGAIYWPAWGVSSGQSANVQAIISPRESQYLAPWYATRLNQDYLQCTQTQDIMDQEIQLAAASGLKYFAFGWYGGAANSKAPALQSNYQVSYNFYQSSQYKHKINWCLYLVRPGVLGSNPFSDTASWQANVDYIVSLFADISYQKVLGTRPLVYIFYLSADLNTYFSNSDTNMGTAIQYMIDQSIAAGYGDPYVVLTQAGSVATSSAKKITLNCDALSNYVTTLGRNLSGATAYASLDSAVQTNWTTMSSLGDEIIPLLQPYADTRARGKNPPPWEVNSFRPNIGLSSYYTRGTPAAIAAGQYTAVGTFIESNPTKVPTKAILVYAWSEFDEAGGAVCPTLYDPPLTDPPYTAGSSTDLNQLLNATGPILYSYR